jgi:hypothetical protein
VAARDELVVVRERAECRTESAFWRAKFSSCRRHLVLCHSLILGLSATGFASARACEYRPLRSTGGASGTLVANDNKATRAGACLPDAEVTLVSFRAVLPSEIAMRRASRAAVAQVMLKCFAQKPGFYEVCEPAFEQGTPGVSFFQMKKSECRMQNAEGRRRNAEGRHPIFVILHFAFFIFIAPCSLRITHLAKAPQGSRGGAHKVPMFGPSVCPRRRRARRKLIPKAAWRMPHGHSEIANRAVDCRRRSESLWSMLIDRVLNTAPRLSTAHRA